MIGTVLSRYLSHLAGYVVAGATVVSSLNPALFPPKYAFLTALAGAIVTAADHGHKIGTAGLNAAVTAAANAASTAMKSSAGAAMALILTGCLLGGCASTQSFLNSPTGQTVVTAGVQVAVATAEQHGATAAQINSVAKAVLAADQGVSATVAALTAAVNTQLTRLRLPPGDVIAFQGLETAFDAYLVAKYGSSATLQQIQADVALFCNQIVADTGG